MHPRGKRPQLEIGDRGLQVLTAMRQAVRLLALLLVNLVVGTELREHSRQCRGLPLARHTAAIKRDVVRRAEENQKRFAGRMRVCSRDAGDDCGQGGGALRRRMSTRTPFSCCGYWLAKSSSHFSSAISMDWRTEGPTDVPRYRFQSRGLP